jgi:hypothetical protein
MLQMHPTSINTKKQCLQNNPRRPVNTHLQAVLPLLHAVDRRLGEPKALGVRRRHVLERKVLHRVGVAHPVGRHHDRKVLLAQPRRALDRVLAGRHLLPADRGRLQVLQRRDDEAVGQLARRVARHGPGFLGGFGVVSFDLYVCEQVNEWSRWSLPHTSNSKLQCQGNEKVKV